MRASLSRTGWMLVTCVAWVAFAAAQQAQIYVSSQAGDRLTLRPALKFKATPAADGPATFTIDASTRYQQIDGFGASPVP